MSSNCQTVGKWHLKPECTLILEPLIVSKVEHEQERDLEWPFFGTVFLSISEEEQEQSRVFLQACPLLVTPCPVPHHPGGPPQSLLCTTLRGNRQLPILVHPLLIWLECSGLSDDTIQKPRWCVLRHIDHGVPLRPVLGAESHVHLLFASSLA